MNKKHILFDFDGTLADTYTVGLKLMQEFAQEQRLSFPNLTQEQLREKTLKSHLRATVPFYRLDITLRLVHHLKRMQARLLTQIDSIELFEGIPELICELSSEYELGILTSNLPEVVQKTLEHHKLAHHFSSITSQPKLWGKAKLLRRYKNHHALENNTLLYIGDETRDALAAYKAGVSHIGVSWGFESELLLKQEVATVVGSVQELKATIAAKMKL